MAKKFTPIQNVDDDDLKVMTVGNWAQVKYKLVGKYCNIFSSGMKNFWNLIYLDLFSGPGYVRNKQSGMLMKNSALISMNVPYQFDHYILNDYDEESVRALETRINRLHPGISYKVYNEDANNCINKILRERPVFDNSKPTLTFCFLDPFSLNLDFQTVRILSQKEQVDILMLHALQMDGQRNLVYYYKDESRRIEAFTGTSNWREKFKQQGLAKSDFMKFISDEFDENIVKLGYKTTDKEQIRNNSGTGIYHLAFYSKHQRGMEFFDKIRGGINDQYELF